MTKIFNEEQTLKDNEGRILSVQYPLSVDGDSVYSKDVDYLNSTITGFSGDVLDFFDDYTIENINTSATNPKVINLLFYRPIKSNKIGIGSLTGNFSNVKIELKDFYGTVRGGVDDSLNSTKYTSNVYQFAESVFIEATISFYTADTVSVNGLFIPKVQSRSITSIDGYISETNSSETNLLANAVFTGGEIDTKDYGMVIVTAFSDVSSATDGLAIQFRSTQSSTWRTSDNFTIFANTEKTFTLQPVRRFMRIVYTNGVSNQTVFDLQTMLKPVYVKPSSHRISDTISGEDDAELAKSIITGQSELTDLFENVRTFRGALSVTDGLRHKTMINKSFHLPDTYQTTLAVQTAVGDISITVVDATGMIVGSWIEVYADDPSGEFIFQITATPGGNVLTLDRPVPIILHVGHSVESVGVNLAVDGTLVSPKIFLHSSTNWNNMANY